MSDDGGESLSRSGSDVALELHRSGSPTSTLSGPTSTFLVSSYNNKAVLAHTPSGDPQGAGVYTVALDGGSGRLRLLGDSPVADNPAFVLPHPALEDVIYVSTERIDADGEVLAFVREPNETGALRLLSRRSSVRSSAWPESARGWQQGAHGPGWRDTPARQTTFLNVTNWPDSALTPRCAYRAVAQRASSTSTRACATSSVFRTGTPRCPSSVSPLTARCCPASRR